MEYAYTAIGRAVFAAQLFETALVPIFQFFKMKSEPGYHESTQGHIPDGAFKMPVKAIVNALAEKGSIAPDLEERLSKYAEDRNMLIHRWIQNHGWPDENDAQGFAPIVELANRVESEAKWLSRKFSGYIVKFADPDWAAENPEEYEKRITLLFHRAHIDE